MISVIDSISNSFTQLRKRIAKKITFSVELVSYFQTHRFLAWTK